MCRHRKCLNHGKISNILSGRVNNYASDISIPKPWKLSMLSYMQNELCGYE